MAEKFIKNIDRLYDSLLTKPILDNSLTSGDIHIEPSINGLVLPDNVQICGIDIGDVAKKSKERIALYEAIADEIKSRGNFKINVAKLVDVLFKLDIVVSLDEE